MALAPLIVFGAGAVALGAYRTWIEKKNWGQHNGKAEQSVRGKVVLITGANSGLGKETAYEMVKRGATVVMACRSLNTAKSAIAEILNRPGGYNGRMVPMQLDLSSLDCIRQFVFEFKKEFDHLDLLINNAGVYIPYAKHQVTQDGFEINFGVNYLGHFLLTNLLLDFMKKGQKGEPSRIVNVASSLFTKGEIRLDDLNLRNLTTEEEKKVKPYNNSKLANVLFSRELANRLVGTGIHTYALCPGWVKTGLFRNSDWKFYHYFGLIPVAFLFMRTVHQGCQTILHCALSNECASETGKIYKNCDHFYASDILPSDSIGKKLWDVSEKMSGIIP